jgi:carboxymethylenebutenolidase
MAEILRHRRETRRQTDKANVCLHVGKDPAYFPIPVPTNFVVRTEEIEYESGDVTVPAMAARPDDHRHYPAVLYQHGRRGLDEFVQRQVKRIAARSFVVLAPDVYSAHFVEKFPIEHDYATELDVANGIDVLLARDDVSTSRACLVSHTKGGYMALKAATTHGRQEGLDHNSVAPGKAWKRGKYADMK